MEKNKILILNNRIQHCKNCSIRSSIKDVRSQGGDGFVQCGNFADKEEGGSSDADVRNFWCKRTRIFWNLWCVHTDKGGWASSDKGGQFFAILCGRPLWTAPNVKKQQQMIW